MEGLAQAIEIEVPTETTETADVTQNTDTTETVDNGALQNNTDKQGKGYTPYVDLSGLPDETRAAIEGRFAHLSTLIRKNETKYGSQLDQWKTIAAQQSQLLEELQNNQGLIASHLVEQKFTDTLGQLQSQRQQALEAGDTTTYLALEDKIIDLKLQQRQAAQAKPQPQQKNQTQQQAYAGQPVRGDQIVNDALADGELSPQDAELASAWATESDASGQPLRPWVTANLDPNDPDPDAIRALIIAKKVFTSDKYANKSFAEKLSELDRQMGVKRPTANQSVMGGNLTTHKKSAKVALSPKQQEIAIRTKFGSSAGAKTDAEYLAAYAKQIEQTRKGAKR